MLVNDIKSKIPKELYGKLTADFKEFRPSQEKSINAGLLDGKSLLVCTPTASGKTLVAEIALAKTIIEGKGKAVYIVPLKALANEKYKEFKKKYGELFKIALSIGDVDRAEPRLAGFDLIICTSEKLDSLIRHGASWINEISVLIVDEIHLLNDPGRGPTLEVLITMLKKLMPNMQIIGLSATIGNPEELAQWLDAELVYDSWRPVKLHQGVYLDGKLDFF